MKRFGKFVVEFLAWSWNDKEHNRNVLYAGIVSLAVIGGLVGHVWATAPSVSVTDEVTYTVTVPVEHGTR